MKKATTLGELKATGYEYKSIKDELRSNLIRSIEAGEDPFAGVVGYHETVIPQLERAILAKHNLSLLGLRGQAKTTIARMMIRLLDEYIPAIEGTELNEDPLQPITKEAKRLIKEKGNDTPIHWIHRSERYTEKLATPDVSVADLIGDLDPIKAANLKLSFSDEGAIHYGLVPHSNRGIFVINELPDLQTADSSSAVQHPSGGRYSNTRIQSEVAARHSVRVYFKPRGLHQPWLDHHATQGSDSKPDHHALSHEH